jgi:hypothetical protein
VLQLTVVTFEKSVFKVQIFSRKYFSVKMPPFKAQAMAVKAECEANGEKPKHKQHYTGNSTHT